MMVTPATVEKRLVELSKEIDEAQRFLDESEQEYFDAKGACEIALAESRLAIRKDGLKFTVQEKEDLATVECSALIRTVYAAEAKVRAARGNAQRVRTQIDIARSVGTSVRASLDN
jgi:uncharacterized protein with von Willebrand factor type A (vWA) domain